MSLETPAEPQPSAGQLLVRQLGRRPYQPVWDAMKAFTDNRTPDTPDEFWVVEHDPVYTQGQAGKAEHLLAPGNIPVVQSDRGGQVTYHGPGQIVAYVLLDLRRRGYGIKELVRRLEGTVIDLLAAQEIKAERVAGAPGVYVGGAKIAALGLRVRNGRTYHGLSLNVDMDMAPFAAINPCGYADLTVTSTRAVGVVLSVDAMTDALERGLLDHIESGDGEDMAAP